MPAAKNVLLIVVDQWRGLMLPKLGADYLKLPNIDALCAEGVTFRNHFTQTVPCGPARASLLTGLYMMNHRAVQNTIPLDSRFTNLAHELRRGGTTHLEIETYSFDVIPQDLHPGDVVKSVTREYAWVLGQIG